ncbi:MAG: OmpA family protein [Gammaproteobacteria bacterium]|nr:OmpA family protein [Gammaproteobacteria bacterium]
MPENTQNRQPQCPLWIWAILLVGLILLYFLYSRATTEKAQEIQQDIQVRSTKNLLESGQNSKVQVATDGRDVTLKGSVNSQDERSSVEKIVLSTVGVRLVDNQIEVQETIVPEAISSEEVSPGISESAPSKLPILNAKVEPMPAEFAPLEDEATLAIEIAKEKFKQLDFSNITFEKSSAALTTTAQQTLDSAANTLNENPSVSISVNGHTDSSGNPELNLEISKKRAKSVFDYLVSAGIDGSRIEANGFGDQFPIAPNDTKAGRIKNRRIEIKVKNGE